MQFLFPTQQIQRKSLDNQYSRKLFYSFSPAFTFSYPKSNKTFQNVKKKKSVISAIVCSLDVLLITAARNSITELFKILINFSGIYIHLINRNSTSHGRSYWSNLKWVLLSQALLAGVLACKVSRLMQCITGMFESCWSQILP